MMRKLPLMALALGAVLVAGCGSDQSSAYPKSETVGGAQPSKPIEPVKIEPRLELTGELAKMPESLKTDALYYYGITNDQSLPIKVSFSSTTKKGEKPTTSELTGDVSVRITSVGSDEVKFAVDRNGDIAGKLGTGEEMLVKADGIYATRFQGFQLKTPSLELPAKLVVGKTWSTNTTIEASGQKITVAIQNKVGAFEKVKSSVGEFDAVRIDSTGTVSSQNETQSVEVSVWLVKGLGPVKTSMKSKNAKTGAEQSIQMELVKPS